MTKWGQANDATKTKIRRIESRSNISSISQEAVFSAQMLFCWWIKWTSCCSLFSILKTAVRTTRGITSQVTSIKAVAGLFVVFIALLPNQIVASRKKGIQVKWGFIDNFLLFKEDLFDLTSVFCWQQFNLAIMWQIQQKGWPWPLLMRLANEIPAKSRPLN